MSTSSDLRWWRGKLITMQHYNMIRNTKKIYHIAICNMYGTRCINLDHSCNVSAPAVPLIPHTGWRPGNARHKSNCIVEDKQHSASRNKHFVKLCLSWSTHSKIGLVALKPPLVAMWAFVEFTFLFMPHLHFQDLFVSILPAVTGICFHSIILYVGQNPCLLNVPSYFVTQVNRIIMHKTWSVFQF